MKKISILVSIALLATLVLCFSSCETKEDYYDGYNDGYEGGTYDGYVDGYKEGTVEGQKELGGYAEYCFSEICSDNDIESALATLILYEEGEAFTEEEISRAIWQVQFFYNNVCDMITEIECYYEEE